MMEKTFLGAEMSSVWVLQYASGGDDSEPVYGVYSSKNKAFELNPTLEYHKGIFGGYWYTADSGFGHEVYLDEHIIDQPGTTPF